jgi:predicted aconitase with swiveling domain
MSNMDGIIEIQASSIGKGRVRGEALVSTEPVSFNNGVESTTGIVVEPGHQLEGQCVTGKVMVFPVGKGSAGGSYVLYDLSQRKTAPCAIINTRSDTIIVIGCVMGRIPMLHRCDKDPVDVIRTGDLVEIDLDAGVITVCRKAQ